MGRKRKLKRKVENDGNSEAITNEFQESNEDTSSSRWSKKRARREQTLISSDVIDGKERNGGTKKRINSRKARKNKMSRKCTDGVHAKDWQGNKSFNDETLKKKSVNGINAEVDCHQKEEIDEGEKLNKKEIIRGVMKKHCVDAKATNEKKLDAGSNEEKVVKTHEKRPIFHLQLNKLFGSRGERSKSQSPRLKMFDIQELIMYSVLGGSQSHPPSWCKFKCFSKLKKTVFVLLSAVGEADFVDNEKCFPFISREFTLAAPTKAGGSEQGFEYPHVNLLSVPLSKKEKRRRNHAQMEQLQVPLEDMEHENREQYLMSKEQLKANEYPPPCYEETTALNNAYVPFCKADEVASSRSSPLFAIDCEMCRSSEGRELTRVSVVNEQCEVVYDSLVKPDRPIVDYVTKYSGITPGMLDGVTVKLEDVQQELQRILPSDAILVGHSLEFDLRALQMYHSRVIDTSVAYVDGRGRHFKPALRHLSKMYLKKDIQESKDGHCSIEDAKTCMELVKLKLLNGPSFGFPKKEKEGLFVRLSRGEKQCTMIDSPGIARLYSSGSHHVIPATDITEIVGCASSHIPKSDFTWIHLHTIENFQKENAAREKSDPCVIQAFEESLRKVDQTVSDIYDATTEHCLLIVMMGHSDVTEVLRLQKHKDSMMEELKREVQETKKGICFFKIT